ncbi:hypothetical protein ACFLV4_01130 [Chloroflexota bacterium]
MPKAITGIFCGPLIVLLIMMTIVSACARKTEPEYAGTVAEGILQAMNDNDYGCYTEHFNEVMKNAAPEGVFQQTNAMIKAKIGSYV